MLVGTGIWGKLDILYVFAVKDAQSSLLNWKNDQYNPQINGATFLSDRGYYGDGEDEYISTGYEPGFGQFVSESHHFGVYLRDGIAVNQTHLGVREPFSGPGMDIGGSTSGHSVRDGMNSNSGGDSVSSHIVSSRDSASSFNKYIDGQLKASTPSLYSMPPYEFYLLAMNAAGVAQGFSSFRIVAAHFGGALTDLEVSILHEILNSYVNAVGA